MSRLVPVLLAVSMLAGLPLTASAEPTIIHAGTLMKRADAPLVHDASIVVNGDRIDAILQGFHTSYQGRSATVIDMSDAFVLPGLIDSHTHITQSPDMFSTRRAVAEVTVSEADRALMGVEQARATLEAGVTTVRNVGGFRGGDGEAIFALRDAIDRGDIVGPRIFAAGQAISIVGGHADTHGFRPAIARQLLSPGICSGADDCALAARRLISRGADLVKVTVTGGVTDLSDSGLGQHLTLEELRAIVEVSHLLGRRVAAHAHSAQGIRLALEAGVDSVEHGTFADAETLEQFKASGAFFVSTLSAPNWLLSQSNADPEFMPPVIRHKLEYAMASLAQATRAAFDAEIAVAMGTDSGVSPHGNNAWELELLVEAGVSKQDALAAATIQGARLLGREADLGAIVEGRFADIIAVCANPLEDIAAMKTVTFVMKGGETMKQSPC